MSEELPDHLKPVRDILMDSANGPEADDVPGAPEDLLDDLEKSLTGTSSAPVPVPQPGFFEKLRRLLATPAFGAVAALVVVLFIAVPLFKGGHGFRNGGSDPSKVTNIVLLGIDDSTYESLTSSGLLDPAGLIRSDSPETLTAPKLVLDFTAGTLTATSADGSVAFEQSLPEDPADLPSVIAQALSQLSQ